MLYRIRSNNAEDQHRYDAEEDITLRDLQEAWPDRTFTDWASFHGPDKTFTDLALAPLAAPDRPRSDIYPDVWFPDQVYPA